MSHYFLCSQNKHSKNRRFFQCMVSDFVAANFFKKESRSPRGFLPTPSMRESTGCGGNSAMPERIGLSPRHLPEYLEGRTPKKNVLSIFRKNWSRANPKSKEHFSLGLPSGARRWRGFRSLRIFDKIGSSE